MEEIRQFLKDGLSITEISKLTGFDRKTVRKYLTGPEVPRYGPRQPRPSKLDPYKPYIEERLTAGVWNAQMLLRELRGRGYDGGCTLIKDYLQPKRDAARLVAVRRFETPPGKQAQVDWGHLGDLLDGERPQRIWGFVFTLGHSRALFADVALNQRLDTFLRLHEEAFRELGGIPEEILYDRVKTVWVGTDERARCAGTRCSRLRRLLGLSPALSRLPGADERKGRVGDPLPALFLPAGLMNAGGAAHRPAALWGGWPTSGSTARRTR